MASRISNAFTLQNHSTTVCFLSADGWGRRREGRVGEEARGRLWQARAACSGECDKHSKGRTHHPDEACQTSQSVVWISWAMLLCLMTQKAVCGLVALAGLTVLLVFNSNRIAEAKPRYAVQAHHQPSGRHHALEEYGKVGPATQNLDDGLGRNMRATSQRKRQRQGQGGGLCASGSGTTRLYIVESIYCAGSPRINKGRWTVWWLSKRMIYPLSVLAAPSGATGGTAAAPDLRQPAGQPRGRLARERPGIERCVML